MVAIGGIWVKQISFRIYRDVSNNNRMERERGIE
jgi:hypothetical protein